MVLSIPPTLVWGRSSSAQPRTPPRRSRVDVLSSKRSPPWRRSAASCRPRSGSRGRRMEDTAHTWVRTTSVTRDSIDLPPPPWMLRHCHLALASLVERDDPHDPHLHTPCLLKWLR